ncbi:MAG: Flp pilus assembly protein CpaB [Candidatus Hadarchaeales archaeon]
MKRQKMYLIAGIVLGLIGFLLVQYTQAEANRTVAVVVAKQHISAGSIVSEGDVELKRLPPAAALPDAFRSTREVVGQKLSVDRAPGDQICKSHLGNVQSLKLEPGWRAVSVKVDAQRGLAGKISPGDKVSIVGVFVAQGTEEEFKPLAKILLSGIEVLFVTHSFMYKAPVEQSVSSGGLLPAMPTLQKQSEHGIIILKVPAHPVPVTFVDYIATSTEVITKEVQTIYVDPAELITYLDAANSLYLVLDPPDGGNAHTSGLRLEDLYLPGRSIERRKEIWKESH